MAVLHLRPPGREALASAVSATGDVPLSYALAGGTRGVLPGGWDHDEQERVIGQGDRDWSAAVAALRAWRPFRLGWVDLHRIDTPIEVGQVVGFVSRQLGVHALNLCRIVYVVDEPDRFGFAYGTLGGHVVTGEELFLLTRDASGTVRFRIRKFSRPNHVLVRLVAPIARCLQRNFTTEAIASMARAVEEAR